MGNKLTKIDNQVISMLENLTKREVTVTYLENRYAISVYLDDKPKGQKSAIKEAVAGYIGKRLIKIYNDPDGVSFHIEYAGKDDINAPVSIDTQRDEPCGVSFKRKQYDVKVIQVLEGNIGIVRIFTGGGTVLYPSPESKDFTYSFITDNGVLMEVPSGYYLIKHEDGSFSKLSPMAFKEKYKAANKVSETDEDSVYELFKECYGDNLGAKIGKLVEEYNEFMTVADDYTINGILYDTIKDDMLDELSDVYCVVYQLARILGSDEKELLRMAYDKAEKRRKEPDYKRKHPHIENRNDTKRN